MHRLSRIAAVLLFVALFIGCDSSEEGKSETELFVGSWAVTRVEDGGGDRTSLVQGLGVFTANFGADLNYGLVFDPTAAGANQTLSSTYSVNETTNMLTLNVMNPITQQPAPFLIQYTFTNDDQVVLTIPATIVALVSLAGFDAFEGLAGDVKLTLSRQN